jgi:hypothetical protein
MSSRPTHARAKPSSRALAATEAEMRSKLHAAGIDDRFAVGYPPAVAASLAGISRQGIMKAVLRGTLEAKTFKLPGAKRGVVAISADSLREYIARNRRP